MGYKEETNQRWIYFHSFSHGYLLSPLKINLFGLDIHYTRLSNLLYRGGRV